MVSLITVIIFGLDRLTKMYILKKFALYESRQFIGKFVSLTFVKNTGAAFSILQGHRTFFLFMTVVMLVFIIYLYNKVLVKNIYSSIAVGLILGGALGNFYDRIVFEYVIDFIDFHFFPVFNLADSALVIGTIMLSVIIWLLDNKKNKHINNKIN